jgi:hypothetical protein
VDWVCLIDRHLYVFSFVVAIYQSGSITKYQRQQGAMLPHVILQTVCHPSLLHILIASFKQYHKYESQMD